MLKSVRSRVAAILLLVPLLVVLVLVIRTQNYAIPTTERSTLAAPVSAAYDLDQAALRLGKLISFRTVTRSTEDPLPDMTGPWLAQEAFLRETYPLFHAATTLEKFSGHTLLFKWQGSDLSLSPIVMMAHQDVVPIDMRTIDNWATDPFSGAIVDGKIYGRGAVDDKGNLIAMMEAAEALIKSGFEPKRTVYYLFDENEEASGAAVEEALTALRDRGIKAEMVLDEGSMILANAPITDKPLAIIGVAEKGYVTIELIAEADGGHSSRPPKDSAPVRLARALLALEENQMPSHLREEPLVSFTRGMAVDLDFPTRLALANQWLLGGIVEDTFSADPSANALIRTTTAPTMLEGSPKENVLPQNARAVINFRIHPRDSVKAVTDHVSTQIKDIPGLRMRIAGSLGSEPSPVSSTQSAGYKVLSDVAREIVPDAPIIPGLVIGATDARFGPIVSENVYRFSPQVLSDAEINGIHGLNEHLTVENLGRMIEGFQHIIIAMDNHYEGNAR